MVIQSPPPASPQDNDPHGILRRFQKSNREKIFALPTAASNLGTEIEGHDAIWSWPKQP
jgi:hypothetical protein